MDVSSTLRILSWPPLPAAVRDALDAGPAAPFEHVEASAAELEEQLNWTDIDLLLLDTDQLPDTVSLPALALRRPVVLQLEDGAARGEGQAAERGYVTRWIAAVEAGVQDVVSLEELQSASAGLRLRAAVVRHQICEQSQHAHSTDLATGLPHQQQFLEHMHHLLALREREPAPMALLVLAVDGLATTLERLGADGGAVLRRKLAVRLRSGLRASDVVAALGDDNFAVLLSWIDSASDVDGVVVKLMASARRPFLISGQPVSLAVRVGVARYPEDGELADVLLSKAMRSAARQVEQGDLFARHAQAGVAANDDDI
ncbi:diguanylate cyclase domain-containing protein [Piscinibacter sakaiensis]|uniref:diguanylate cyclase domain-containing protein n=1 Tax=Piscinibacter sakaiensis TaxID=1547922 RepID=UPI003AB05B7A